MATELPKIAYFGPENTNTHAAALELFGRDASYWPELSKTGVFSAVESGRADLGVIPVENSTEGVVRETIDCLISFDLLIQKEFEIKIEHCLIAHPNSELYTSVVSHPQPLAQCREWLLANQAELPTAAAASTATAARIAAENPGTLAIATRLAAEAFGLKILEENISDCPNNATRFLVIGKEEVAPTDCDKTTLVCKAPHEQGALLSLLTILNEEGINLTRIESRPLVNKKWEYAFVIDVEGHEQKQPLLRAVSRLREADFLYRSAGSYPRSSGISASMSPPAAAHLLE